MKTTCGLLLIELLVFSYLNTAYAERYVVVNGQRCQSYSLDLASCLPMSLEESS